MSDQPANPFNPRAVLALALLGAALFVALLYMIGSGMDGGSTNDGGGHAGARASMAMPRWPICSSGVAIP